jgi:hypothetical protein
LSEIFIDRWTIGSDIWIAGWRDSKNSKSGLVALFSSFLVEVGENERMGCVMEAEGLPYERGGGWE